MTTSLSSHIWDEYISTADLTAFGREVFENLYQNNTVRPWFPTLTIEGLDYEYKTGFRRLQEQAQFRAFDAPPNVVGRTYSESSYSGTLPPLSEQERLSEIHILKDQNASDARIRGVVLDMAANLVSRIGNVMEAKAANALEFGKFSLQGGVDGLETGDIEFGRAADLTFALATPWSDPAANIPQDLMDLNERVADHNGLGLGTLLMPMATRTLMVLSLIHI